MEEEHDRNVEERADQGPGERAERMERRAGRMEDRSEGLEREIEGARRDWETKKREASVPGAQTESGASDAGVESEPERSPDEEPEDSGD